jgi:Tfp pilus assembly protein PilZ
LQFLSIFANHASIALQNQYLLEEVRKAASLRQNYERYLDDLMHQLQSLSGEERRRIDEHIGRFLSGLKADKPVPANPVEKSAAREKGVINLAGEMSFEDSPENLTEKVQVEIEDFIGKPGADVSRAGVFIPTGNPRDLGEQFILRLHLSEGRLLELPCKVIFTNKYGKESQNLRRGMGIKFLDLPTDLQKQLEDYVRLCKEQEGSSLKSLTNPRPRRGRNRNSRSGAEVHFPPWLLGGGPFIPHPLEILLLRRQTGHSSGNFFGKNIAPDHQPAWHGLLSLIIAEASLYREACRSSTSQGRKSSRPRLALEGESFLDRRGEIILGLISFSKAAFKFSSVSLPPLQVFQVLFGVDPFSVPRRGTSGRSGKSVCFRSRAESPVAPCALASTNASGPLFSRVPA